MDSTARATVWLALIMFAFLTSLGFTSVIADKNLQDFQVQCLEAGGSVDDGECVVTPKVIREP